MNAAPSIADAGAESRPAARGERFSRAQRLRRPADFDELRRTGRRIEAGAFLLRLKPRADGPRRLGVIASRKTGSAVRRNRAKRVLRELFRRNQDALPPSCDVVVVVRPGFFEHDFAAIRERYLNALRHAQPKKA